MAIRGTATRMFRVGLSDRYNGTSGEGFFTKSGVGPTGDQMRDGQTIEEELVEIGAIADDSIKLERIIAWCATYPDEVPFAIRFLLGKEKNLTPPEKPPQD